MKQYLAIDIGGTAVKLGIVDEEGRVLSKTEQSVCFDNYETPILTTVLSVAEQFLKEQAVEPQGLAGIGVSAAGQIDTRQGIVAGTCGSLPNYIGSPIKAELEAKFGLPTTVANDANCMTLGEVWVGGAKGYTDVIGVTLGPASAAASSPEAACWKVRGVSAVSWDTSAPTRWMACSAPAARRAAGSGTPQPPLWCGAHSPGTRSGRMAALSLNRPMQATPPSWRFWTTGRMRSLRALRAWCISSTRSSSSSAAASAHSRSC